MKCTDCGSKEFVAYNEETALMCCADCGQFYQIKIKELEDLRRQLDELKTELDKAYSEIERLKAIEISYKALEKRFIDKCKVTP